MDNTVRAIIDIDKQARLRAEDIKEFRAAALENLEEQKQQALLDEQKRTQELIRAYEESCRAKIKTTLNALAAQEEAESLRLNERYDSEHEKWVNDIFKRVVSS